MHLMVIVLLAVQFQSSMSKFVPIAISTWNFESATRKGIVRYDYAFNFLTLFSFIFYF